MKNTRALQLKPQRILPSLGWLFLQIGGPFCGFLTKRALLFGIYIGGPKVSTHRTGHKIERSCGVAEGPEVLFTLARPAE